MATITSPDLVERLLENEGLYSDDPPAESIWEYRSTSGQLCWAVFYEPEPFGLLQLLSSPYVLEAVLLWEREAGLLHEIGILNH